MPHFLPSLLSLSDSGPGRNGGRIPGRGEIPLPGRSRGKDGSVRQEKPEAVQVHGPAAGAAVLAVVHDGVPGRGELHADLMRPAGFQNLGCGWDRIENVLWRIYHGELDGYKAGKVVLMIGTNNCGLNNDKEIVEGLRFLLSAIRQRQPEASVKVIGILPRRNQEQWVRNINFDIKEMVETEGYEFANPGTALLLQDGKINESLFIGDGLHPNDKGYELIAGEIASSNKSY